MRGPRSSCRGDVMLWKHDEHSSCHAEFRHLQESVGRHAAICDTQGAALSCMSHRPCTQAVAQHNCLETTRTSVNDQAIICGSTVSLLERSTHGLHSRPLAAFWNPPAQHTLARNSVAIRCIQLCAGDLPIVGAGDQRWLQIDVMLRR